MRPPTFARALALALALALAGCAAPTPLLEPGPDPTPVRTLLAATRPVAEHDGEVRRVAAKPGADPQLTPVEPALLETCVDRRVVRVEKAARRVELRCGDRVAARFDASLGFAPRGAKRREGDGKTPEGDYFTTSAFPSAFHRSLQVAYPNVADADRGLDAGVIDRGQHAAIVRAYDACRQPPQNTALGSLIQIHGGGGSAEAGDWTLGCVALEDAAIDAVAAFHRPGCDAAGPRTLVRIVP